ncbi:MAG: IS66 family insertion sequence element accessory protein TnpB [Deltaproteobacteria bacterium]|nr:IS66 family insertion sequence element accessory protein TnpB [Deltaproteobacteria bacterium]
MVLASRPVLYMKQHDGLAAVMEEELGLDPYSGMAVVFRCRRRDRIKS